MKIAQIWYHENRDLPVFDELTSQKPNWEVDLVHEQRLNYFSVENIIEHGYDVILTHLSHPYALGIRLAELTHIYKYSTKIILLSNTKVDENILQVFYDGLIRFDEPKEIKCDKIEISTKKKKEFLELEKRESLIEKLIRGSVSIQDNFRRLFKNRHKEEFFLSDYYTLIGASLELVHKNFVSRNDFNQLVELIEKDQLKRVFEFLHGVKRIERNKDLFKELTILENRFTRNNNSHRKNTVSIDEFNLENNKITEGLIEVIDKFYYEQNEY